MATTDVDLPGCRDQILEVLPYGRVFVRGVHRCLLVLPQSEGKIIQEDCCITPVSASLVQQHAAAIRLAVTQRLNRRLSNNPAPKPTDPAVQAALRELSVTTGMNEAYAWQCLSECGFNLHAALEAFRNVMEANLLPPEAFAK
ncbi:nuclear RNA export factor 1/2 [Clonorchis sinensis]|nr:nuclear RNA export factor 1/2 [Clonorchis sinensis]